MHISHHRATDFILLNRIVENTCGVAPWELITPIGSTMPLPEVKYGL